MIPASTGTRRPSERSLHDIEVVDLGTTAASALVAKYLADRALQVTRGAPISIELQRDYPALCGPHAPWREGAGVDPHSLIAAADVCLVDAPGLLATATPSAAALREAHPRLIVLEIAGGETESCSGLPATELLIQTETGLSFQQFSAVPTQLAFGPATHGAALAGVISIWAALRVQAETGRGTIIRTSLQRGMTMLWPHLLMVAERPSAAFDRLPPRDAQHLIFRCADGRFVQLVLPAADAISRVYRVLGIGHDPAPGDGVPDPRRGPADYFAERAGLTPQIADLDSSEVIARLSSVDIPCAIVMEPGECFDDEQLAVLGYLKRSQTGVESIVSVVDVQVARRGDASVTRRPALAEDRHGPLSGVRVVDFGNFVAGPFASRLLADLGADVIQVEPPGGIANLTGRRNVWVCTQGKRSLCLDLKSEESRPVLTGLLCWADVVLHNLRPAAAARLGLDAAWVRKHNPNVIHLHTTAFGAKGPRSDQPGFDMVLQAFTGHETRAGGRGNDPLWYRAPFVDYCAGALGAAAIAEALYRRDSLGEVCDATVTLLGAALFLLDGMTRDPDGTVHGAQPLLSNRSGFAPSRALYRARDGWLSIEAMGTDQIKALCRVFGLSEAGPCSPLDERAAQKIAQRCQRETIADLRAQLTKAGIPSAPCAEDLLNRLLHDSSAWESGLVRRIEDPEFGWVSGCLGPYVRIDGDSTGTTTAPPRTGQHTAQLLTELGAAAAEIATLTSLGAGSPEPSQLESIVTRFDRTTRREHVPVRNS